MNLFKSLKKRVKTDVLLSNYTTFRIGGRADFFAQPKDLIELRSLLKIARENNLRVFILGGGSNLLVSDEGVRGVVVRLNSDYFKRIRVLDNCIKVGAGLRINRLLDFCIKRGLSGIESLAGIPGTIGGAVVMNAGTKEGYIGERIKKVKVLDYQGSVKQLDSSDIRFGYRQSNLEKFIVLEVLLELIKKSKKQILDRINYFMRYRKATQEISLPCAGCIFKNPPGYYAGELIDACGLKGKTIGDAGVSLKHANFIVNYGKATAKDVLKLIDYIRKEVKKKFDIDLELEIKLW